MIFVKPVEGRRCKDPITCLLIPEAGRNVPKNSYWLKRLERGDCVSADVKKKAKPEKKTEKKAKKKIFNKKSED